MGNSNNNAGEGRKDTSNNDSGSHVDCFAKTEESLRRIKDRFVQVRGDNPSKSPGFAIEKRGLKSFVLFRQVQLNSKQRTLARFYISPGGEASLDLRVQSSTLVLLLVFSFCHVSLEELTNFEPRVCQFQAQDV